MGESRQSTERVIQNIRALRRVEKAARVVNETRIKNGASAITAEAWNDLFDSLEAMTRVASP